MKLVTTIAALATLAGCTTTDAAEPSQAAETIRYETSPCFGTCPVYVVTASSDGHGTFEGKRFTAVIGERQFALTPRQFADFRKRLQAYRPAEGERRVAPGETECGPGMTDQPGVTVGWSGGNAAPARLSLYYGCMAHRLAAMKTALRTAPDALPIGPMIGPPVSIGEVLGRH